MKFQVPLLLLASLLTYVSGEAADTRSHARDFTDPETFDPYQDFTTITTTTSNSQFTKRNPTLQAGKDTTKLHVWIRLDTRPTAYDDRGGATHEGLNQLMKDTGGRHKDVVIGNPSKGYHEYGLMFNDKSWMSKKSGDGAPISAYTGAYATAPGEAFTYKGQVKDGRKTLSSLGTVAIAEIKGKLYNHKTYNCETFANHLVAEVI